MSDVSGILTPTSVNMQKKKFLLKLQPWPKGSIAAATEGLVHQRFRVLFGKEALKCELTVHSDGFETVDVESAVSSTLVNFLH